jgi:tetratricopeptide (TPR) repeat protein
MHPDRLELVNHLHKDGKLSEPVRQAVLRRAGPKIAFDLNNHSWLSVAQKPDASPEACRRAVREAEEACRLMPGDGNYLNTLGVVQYRAKQYDKALATMLQSTRINRGKEFRSQANTYLPGPHYSDLAFLAMCYAQKGQSGEAKKFLEELEKLMESTAWKDNNEAKIFLAESQKLIAGQARAGLPH